MKLPLDHVSFEVDHVGKHKEPVEYVSPRGSVWHDIAFDVPGLEALLPIIVQPSRPEEMAKAWPFPLKETHPNELQG